MPHWGYTEKNGPSTWNKDFPIADGSRQSPIDIVTSEAVYDTDLLSSKRLYVDYIPEDDVQLQNNGHSVMCQITKIGYLKGGPLGNQHFRLEQFHLHWGADDNRGSEHTIDGKMFAAELHLVHWNTKYGTFAEAVTKSDGLAVLGVMIKPGHKHRGFSAVSDNLNELSTSGSKASFPISFDPTSLLPDNISAYWTYEGSLTTPPLFESVQWIVFKEPVEFSDQQLNALRRLTSSDGHDMQDNYRPPVPTKGRKVRSTFRLSEQRVLSEQRQVSERKPKPAHWGYTGNNGPSTWNKDFPIAEGSRQSPIDIVTSEAVCDIGLMASHPLSVDYTPEDETQLQNNGHSVMCQITKAGYLTGGPLGKQQFRLEQFHLHWGADDNRGSEHTIDGKMFASELHLVHWNTKYGTFAEAVTKSDGLAVLGVMIKPGLNHRGFSAVSENLSSLKKPGSKASFPISLDPTSLLPDNISAYWTYEGSLTTPPLFESVQWIVFKEPVEFSNQQLNTLRSLTSSDGDHMQDNYRPTVPTKGRKVRSTFQLPEQQLLPEKHQVSEQKPKTAHWGYTETNGPSTWNKDFPIAGGSRQSPINIVTSEAVCDISLVASIPLSVDYTPEDETQLSNNGHSVMCQITKTGYLTGGPLGKQQFRLEQFHLHWGADDHRGSEHTIDGKMFASELHLVHWNTKYGTFAEAVTKSDGLAVLGVMIKPGLTHRGFCAVSDNVSSLRTPGSKATFPISLDPTSLLPDNISAYWTYEGSLTTPPLFESVQWIVFKEPVEFSDHQLNALRSLTSSDGHYMHDNYRPPVPTKGRKVRATFQLSEQRQVSEQKPKAAHWGYTETNGPSTWNEDFPIAEGSRQSPIDIVTSEAVCDIGLMASNPLSVDYTPEDEAHLSNNGHSVMCQITKTGYMTGGPLGKQQFRLEQFHLHWGADDNRGSEHTIDGKMFASELHLVHWNTKYGTFAEAVTKSDGLAVLGVMIKPGLTHRGFSAVSDNLSSLRTPGSKATFPISLDPASLLPVNISAYWTYEGSLTTPPLFESVQWIVFKEPVEFSHQQLNALRGLTSSDGHHMQDNYRPPVPTKGRKVRSTFQLPEQRLLPGKQKVSEQKPKAAHWGYTETNGPSTWNKDFPIAEGIRQSPIDIVTSEAVCDIGLTASEPLSVDYTPEDETQLQNNGHSVMCQITKTGYLTGGPLGKQQFRLEQFHLHWGADDNRGSEHTIDGKTFASELHLVHWNTKYDTFGEAVTKSDGLAVLGVMIKPGLNHRGFSAVSNNLSSLRTPGSKATFPISLNPTSLLPDNISAYWTYEGSLTTPPLFESVQWIVFKEPVEFSHQQLTALRSLTSSDGHHMHNNYRPPVPTKGRKVRSTFQLPEQKVVPEKRQVSEQKPKTTPWGYTATNGPSTWNKDFPIAEGSRQSPINIVTSEAVCDFRLMNSTPLSVDYKMEDEIQLQNNGHSVMCQITKTGYLTGGPLGKQQFRLEQFHLHWGADDNQGSEHTIDGKMFASELHLVHWNTKYGTFAEAVTKSDGLAVLGVMIKSGLNHHRGFSAVSDNLGKLKKPGSKATFPIPIDPKSLLPVNISAYWTYEGSLTTPPLFESVQWIVFNDPVEFSEHQLKALRSLTSSDGHHMQNNYRPPVPTKGRNVRATFQRF
ncbi:uncharacterized protein LOC127880170 isoform X4 [Dreissena polymorpha]|uniref:uncharacterized protein LOC127880170 isoform X4 n=1 Tax=Dreissena polymorpha TaxID=45954 RepID=UPI002264352F|nr:uncharacterized protein LOC127880170 isoform X4 [Dreissena polymorpha]